LSVTLFVFWVAEKTNNVTLNGGRRGPGRAAPPPAGGLGRF
ncbi:MAG: hypothetical protein QOD07_1883, partial [Frankiaceae bacterium]|nr:hypothetical protein [Frankiaceae bacterium]